MKLGIVGSGVIVQNFLTITPYLKETELTAICGTIRSEAAIKELSIKYNIKNMFNNYEEFLNSEVDTVFVALPNNLHFQFAKEALEVGKNVIIEKPFTSTYKESLILSELAREKQLFIFEAITNQYCQIIKKLKNFFLL